MKLAKLADSDAWPISTICNYLRKELDNTKLQGMMNNHVVLEAAVNAAMASVSAVVPGATSSGHAPDSVSSPPGPNSPLSIELPSGLVVENQNDLKISDCLNSQLRVQIAEYEEKLKEMAQRLDAEVEQRRCDAQTIAEWEQWYVDHKYDQEESEEA